MKSQSGDKSVKLQFQILPNEAHMYVSDVWLSNRHWMVKRAAVMQCPSLNATFKRWTDLIHGYYECGVRDANVTSPDFDQFVPTMDGYQPAKLSGFVTFEENSVQPEIGSVWLSSESASVAIAPRYAGLLVLGNPYIASEDKPVVIRDAADEVVAVVMPRRERKLDSLRAMAGSNR